MASHGSTLPISAAGITHVAAGVAVPLLRLRVELAFARRTDAPLRRQCFLDTGAPVSVVPSTIHQAHDLAWQPLPGPWPPGLTTWLGVPCIVGCMDVWFPALGAPFLRGPFRFLAKFAQATPSGLAGPPPILLGLNFLADHHADTNFQCHTPPQAGSIVVP